MDLRLEATTDITEVGTATMARRVDRSSLDDVDIAPGTVIGRYVVEAMIGTGGMGVVFRARDQGLDRVVALKRLYPEHVRAHGEGRLLREARAMAQLSHPNVVPVYGVERWQGGAVLTMEFVEGRSLEEWLRSVRARRERTTAAADGLRFMLAAGEGLRAAHDAGLVHRDFKPSNVLVGDDGRVRVVDFGLALQGPLAPPSAEPESRAWGEGAPAQPEGPGLDTRTEGGRLMGTVAYMAPEQLLGIPADARSDQYAYCVSLWEVLCGRRPFHGAPVASLEAKLEGPPPWPSEIRTPPRIVAAIRRGLSPRPEARWPSMAELLTQLHAARRPRRPALGWLGALATVVGLGAFVGLRDEAPAAPTCTGAAEHLVGVWDDERRAAIAAALASADEIHRRDTWPRVEPRLDTWAAAWAGAHTEACEATSVRGEATELELDARMSCLQGALDELRVVVGALAQADAADRAVELVAGLPDAASCLEPQALPASALAPGDPALAAAVAELREALVEVQIRVRSSQVQAAAAAVEPLVERARAIGWEPILMEALQARGVVALRTGEFAAAERDFVELHALARAQGLPLPELRAAESLSMVVGHHQGRYAEGMAWAETALALVEREPTLAEHEVEVLENKAVLLHEQGKYDEAAALQRRVLVLREGRDDALALASSIDVLGSIVERQGRTHEAIALQRRALELAERELGPEHVTVAVSLNNLASSLIAVGEPAQAVPLLERALRIREREAGPSSPRLVSVLNNLGLALMTEGELEQAELHLQRTLALLEASFPDGHPHVGSALVNLGELYAKQGRLDESRRYAERSFAVWERTLGPTHPKLALVLDSLGKLALREGRAAAALEPLRRALALRESALGAEHPLVAESLVYLGLASMAAGELRQARDLEARAQRALAAGRMDDPALRGLVELLAGRLLLHEGRPAQAIPPLERATGLEGWPEAEAALALAMALWDGGGERSRAVALARQAQASFLALGHATRAEQAERWLLRHRAAPR